MLVTETLGSFSHFERMQVFSADLVQRGIVMKSAITVPLSQKLTVRPWRLRSTDLHYQKSGAKDVICSVFDNICLPTFQLEHGTGFICHSDVLAPDADEHIIFDKPIVEDFKPFQCSFKIPGSSFPGIRFLIAEWICYMGNGTSLENTIEHVSKLPPLQFTSR